MCYAIKTENLQKNEVKKLPTLNPFSISLQYPIAE